MHLDLVQTVSLAGKISVPNDDRIGCGDRHAWVIDGATDLGEPGLFGGRGGAAWIAAEAHVAFACAAGPIEAICDGVFAALASAYARERRRDPAGEWEMPSAAMAAVALEGDMLGCAWLADCVVLHRGAEGVRFVTPAPDRRTERADAAALGGGGGSQAVAPAMLLADRRAARSGPRRVLGVDVTRTRAATAFRRISVEHGDDLLLMSDGFVALVEAYDAYDAAGLFAAADSDGLAALASELRRIEATDAACVRFPRFKVSDDASAIWVRIG